MSKYVPAIVVVAYNRPISLKRLLQSLNDAAYPMQGIPLVLSLDKSGNTEVESVARSFEWKYGEKRLITHSERLGLRLHVLSCGDLSEEYGSLIMLEDDLFVSPAFYLFASDALSFASENKRIAGISLYSHAFNVFARLPFTPIDDGYSNWYFRFASSWGQAWTKEQWRGFRDWVSSMEGKDLPLKTLPSDIARWGNESWLKYAMAYLEEKELFYLYPRISLTTNFFDQGEHAKNSVTDLQVPLSGIAHRDYLFSNPEDSRAIYDPYFENMGLDYPCDLYGLKYRDGNIKGKFYSTLSLPHISLKSYGLSLKPMEANIHFSMPGNEIKLYDSSSAAPAGRSSKGILEEYFYPGLNKRKLLNLLQHRLFK
ncbi:MAG: hypothetical protein J6O55_05400 [Lachnospiraceae bacterium]|nr:hypothetical protein [Lachnospiraceae bacterium]